MNPLLAATLGVGILVVAAAAYLVMRQNRRPKVTTRVGAELVAGGRPSPDRPRAEPGRPDKARPDRPRAEPGPLARLTWPKAQREEKAPAKRATADPRLTGPVVLEAAWSQSVYHGSRSTEDGFKIAVRAATARGRSHAYNGEPGQDAAGVAWCESRRSVFLVVADGLGSKPDSGHVARDVVDQVTGRAAGLRQHDDPSRMLALVVDAVEQSVRRGGLEGASTLVAAEVRLGDTGPEVRTWGIGDSEAWLLAGGAWRPLHHERRADTENITRHLPGHREMHTRHVRVPRGGVVALASDGVASALGGNSPVARELADAWRRPPAPLDFLAKVNFEDPYFNDDRAAVAVWIQ